MLADQSANSHHEYRNRTDRLFLYPPSDFLRNHSLQAKCKPGHLNGLRPEDLFPHDHDHYGGLQATDELGVENRRAARMMI